MQNEKKITLNLSQFTPPAPKPKTVPPKPKPVPPAIPTKPVEKPIKKPVKKTPEPKPLPPVAKKKIVKKQKGFEVAQKSQEENNATKIAKKEIKKTPKKKKIVKAKKKPLKRVKKKRHIVKKKPLPTTFRLPKKRSRDGLANALMHDSKPHKSSSGGRIKPTRLIQRLYGKEFYTFTKTQQKFIKDHLSEIHRITQNTLVINGYPEVAVRTGQQGTNVVSFYLHPNGDISHLRLVKPMGYEALDKNTIAVIQIAYKDYPRPKTKTKIVFYVNYSLY